MKTPIAIVSIIAAITLAPLAVRSQAPAPPPGSGFNELDFLRDRCSHLQEANMELRAQVLFLRQDNMRLAAQVAALTKGAK